MAKDKTDADGLMAAIDRMMSRLPDDDMSDLAADAVITGRDQNSPQRAAKKPAQGGYPLSASASPTQVDQAAAGKPAANGWPSFKEAARKRSTATGPSSARCTNYEIPETIQEISRAESIDQGAEAKTLQEIVATIHSPSFDLRGYSEHRERWLRANIRLNHEGSLAPLYRPRLPPARQPATEDQLLYALDRQIVDVHWLHCTGGRRRLNDPLVSTLLATDTFDWDTARGFAEADVRFEWKVDRWLALSDLERWQMAALHTPATRKRLSAIMNGDRSTPGADQIRAALANVHEFSAEREAEIDRDVMLWRVSKMMPTASSTARATLYARGMGHKDVIQPHVYERKQQAAIKRIERALKG